MDDRIDYLEFEQVRRLAAWCDSTDREVLYLIVWLLFWGALRLSELVSLTAGDIDFESGQVRLRWTKRDKERFVKLPADVAGRLKMHIKHNRDSVEKWSADWQKAVSAEQARLEKRYPGEPARVHRALMVYMQDLKSPLFGITYGGIYKAVARLPAAAGLDVVISPHTFRHSFARYWLASGKDIGELSQYLGHSSVAITYDHYGRFNVAKINRSFDDLVTKQAGLENRP